MKEKEIKRFNMNKAGGKFPEGEIVQGDGGSDCPYLRCLKCVSGE